jgi:hypothetical protein
MYNRLAIWVWLDLEKLKRERHVAKKEMPISEQGVISRGLTKTKEDNK